MKLEAIKEELRNKRGELSVGVVAAGFALAIAQISTLAGLGMLVAAIACGLTGIKDWGSGRKLMGGLFGAFAILLFFLGAGVTLEESECRKEATTEAAREKCQEAAATDAGYIRRFSGLTLFLLFANPILGCFFRQRLHTASTFAEQFGVRESTKLPNRWFSKEKDFEAFVLEELEHAGITGRQRYEWVCDVRGVAPERHDDGARYDWKAHDMLSDAPWHSVYELVARCWPVLGFLHKDHFERRVNEYLRDAQIGWTLKAGKWARVGDEIEEDSIQKAANACEDMRAKDARTDLEKAWRLCNTLGEGYEKDAVVAAIRALERVAQGRTNQQGVSLNRIKWEDRGVPHQKLRGVINNLYSYSSDQARHANQGAAVTARDAHFVIGICTSLIIYLSEEYPRSVGEDSMCSDSTQDEVTQAGQGDT